MKRKLSALLAVMILLSVVPSPAFADGATHDETPAVQTESLPTGNDTAENSEAPDTTANDTDSGSDTHDGQNDDDTSGSSAEASEGGDTGGDGPADGGQTDGEPAADTPTEGTPAEDDPANEGTASGESQDNNSPSNEQSANQEEMKPKQVEIPATDIDVADVMSPMTVGSSQVLTVSVIPADATQTEVIYTSLTPKVASVNAIGRVRALATGKARITISVGAVSQTVSIEVTEPEGPVYPTAIDLNGEEKMKVGGTQTLYASVLPAEAQADITYYSSDSDILKVNDFGKVTAVAAGTAKITARTGSLRTSLTITVEDVVYPTDIDFDTPSEDLVVGSSIPIGASVLPMDAEESKISYSSSNPAVAKVNDAGRITGVSVGTATIFLRAGGVTRSFEIKVVEETVVTSLEVGDYTKKMKVDAAQNLSVTAYPTNAKDTKISYNSSDTAVATVSEGGVIKAISAGKVTITVSCGNAKEELELKVYVPTEKIQLPESYVILQPSDSYQIAATVQPKEADQVLAYKSTNTAVAVVSENGRISAKGIGKASVIISNEDSVKVLTVIVNDGADTESFDPSTLGQDPAEAGVYLSTLAEKIQNSENGSSISADGTACPLITSDVLQVLFNTQKSLEVYYDDYTLTLSGRTIKNPSNELSTNIHPALEENRLLFSVDNALPLPGELQIRFPDLQEDFRYFYLYDSKTEQYTKLNDLEQQAVTISSNGTYVITSSKQNTLKVPHYVLFAGGGLLLIFAVTFVVVKKKYWFW